MVDFQANFNLTVLLVLFLKILRIPFHSEQWKYLRKGVSKTKLVISLNSNWCYTEQGEENNHVWLAPSLLALPKQIGAEVSRRQHPIQKPCWSYAGQAWSMSGWETLGESYGHRPQLPRRKTAYKLAKGKTKKQPKWSSETTLHNLWHIIPLPYK